MNDDLFDFDIDAELASVSQKTEQRANEVPEEIDSEEDCDSCKI